MAHDQKARPRRPMALSRLESLEVRQLLAAFVVTNVADNGAGSLRQAILDNDATSGTNSISFAIPGPGVHTIAPASPLPEINNPAILDATTQPGYVGMPLIELNGANIFQMGVTPPTQISGVDGLVLSGGSSVVKGLTIDRFTGVGILTTRDGNTIAGNFIGTDPTGTRSLGNAGGGLSINSRNNTIGGATAASRNLISGNSGVGIYLQLASNLPANNVVQGNEIGTDLTGTQDLGNANAGIIVNASNNLIGGNTAAQANIIAFNGGSGVEVGYYSFESVNRDRISHNSIFQNAGIGIDLGGDGVSINQPGGYTFGPNNLQTFPALTSIYSSGTSTTVEGSIDTAPNTAISVEFFSSFQADPSGYGQGQTFLASRSFLTDGNGHADITSDLAVALPLGTIVSATATDSSGNTSEFARSIGVASTALSNLSVIGLDQNLTTQATIARSYTFDVTNNGPSRATNVRATDTLPVGATFLSGTSTQGTLAPTGGTVGVNLGTLASGASAQFTLTYSVPIAGSALNTVTVQSDQADPVPLDNTLTQNFQVNPAPAVDLALTASATPPQVQVGDPITYTFVATNLDFAHPATGVTLTDALPATALFVSAQSSQGTASFANGVVTANLGTITPGFNAVITIVLQSTTAGSLTNSATVKGNETDPNSINNQARVSTSILPAPATDLAVIVTAAPQVPQVGHSFTYAILVGNPGTGPATGVVLTDLLPEAATIVSIKPSQGTASVVGGFITANIGSLAPGALAELTIVLIPRAPGVIVDQAAVSGDQPDFNVVDNYSMLGTLVAADGAAPTILYQKLNVDHNVISSVVLTFDKALDPTLANNPANYQILDLGQNGTNSGNGPVVPIAAVLYDPITRSVTLVPSKSLSIGRFYKLVVNGPGAPGVVDTSGNVLDGAGNGLQNSEYTALIARGTTTRPTALQVGASTPVPTTSKTSSHATKTRKVVTHKVSIVPARPAHPSAVARKHG